MKFLTAVKTEDGKTARLVFQLTNDLYAVVKIFDQESTTGRPRTVKIWDVRFSSLRTTMSFWSTNVKFEPTAKEIKDAASVITELTKWQ